MWAAYLQSEAEKPLLTVVRKHIGLLKYITKEIPIASTKILLEGLVISRIIFLLLLCPSFHPSTSLKIFLPI